MVMVTVIVNIMVILPDLVAKHNDNGNDGDGECF